MISELKQERRQGAEEKESKQDGPQCSSDGGIENRIKRENGDDLTG